MSSAIAMKLRCPFEDAELALSPPSPSLSCEADARVQASPSSSPDMSRKESRRVGSEDPPYNAPRPRWAGKTWPWVYNQGFRGVVLWLEFVLVLGCKGTVVLREVIGRGRTLFCPVGVAALPRAVCVWIFLFSLVLSSDQLQPDLQQQQWVEALLLIWVPPVWMDPVLHSWEEFGMDLVLHSYEGAIA